MPFNIVKNYLSQISNAIDQAAANTTLSGALFAEGEAKKSMQGPKTGRIYKVSKTGKLHQASAPGEAPAIDTANLVNSIQHEQVGRRDARTFTNTEYGPPLEFGTAKMAARPFMIPAALKSVDYLQVKSQQELDKALGRFAIG